MNWETQLPNKLQTAIEKTPVWQDAFRSCAVKAGFHIGLSRAMVEFISAIADDVCWDRSKWGACAPFPDNFLATSASLVKRGLVIIKPQEVRDRRKCPTDSTMWQWSNFELTPAGRHIVELLKIAGFFVEADAAIEKRGKKK